MSRFEYLGLKWRAIVWLVFGRPGQALQCFDAILQRLPNDPYALSSRANQHMQAGRLDAALADSQRLVQVRSEDAATWFNHGFILEALERWDEALTAFSRATELSPKLDRAWYGLGLPCPLVFSRKWRWWPCNSRRHTDEQAGSICF